MLHNVSHNGLNMPINQFLKILLVSFYWRSKMAVSINLESRSLELALELSFL